MNTMQEFLQEKWLWEEYCVYYVDKKINRNIKNYPTKEERLVSKKLCIDMHKNWKTYREIWKSFTPPISYQTAYNYINK